MKKIMNDADFAKSGGEIPPNSGLEFQVVEKTECLSIDYIQKVQQFSKTDFCWDP